MNLASSAKLAVAETFSSRGAFPASNASAGLAVAASINGNNVTSVTVGSSGVITVVYRNDANITGKTLILTPSSANAGSVTWTCLTGTVDAKYRPSNCR
jgi:type IV pilus assembly protein PilA